MRYVYASVVRGWPAVRSCAKRTPDPCPYCSMYVVLRRGSNRDSSPSEYKPRGILQRSRWAELSDVDVAQTQILFRLSETDLSLVDDPSLTSSELSDHLKRRMKTRTRLKQQLDVFRISAIVIQLR